MPSLDLERSASGPLVQAFSGTGFRVDGVVHTSGLKLTPQAATGWAAPAAGGPRSRDLTPGQKAIDREARLTISRELGHEREQITAVYLGR